MKKTTYRVAGTNVAYGVQPGETVELDGSDHLVQANVTAGVLVPAGGKQVEKDERMTCPLCVERGLKEPPKFPTPEELAEHYTQRHEGFETPDWRAE